MRIKLRGASDLEKEYAIDVVNFCCSLLMSKRLQENLDITVKFIPGLFEASRQCGNCIWEDDYVRPKEFTIEIDPTQDKRTIIETLCHELVHVKQFATGEMRDLQSDTDIVNWKGKRYNRTKYHYFDLPWEIDAHGREVGLFVRWAESRKLGHLQWTQV